MLTKPQDPSILSGEDLRAVREKLELSQPFFGWCVGYTSNAASVAVAISQIESGARPVPAHIARVVHMIDMHGMPRRFTAWARLKAKQQASLAVMTKRLMEGAR